MTTKRAPLPVEQTPAAVLFDLDGTLIDSAVDLAAAANLMRNHRQKVNLPLERYRPMAGSGAAGMLRVAFDMDADHPDYAAMRSEYLDTYERLLDAPCGTFDGIATVLQYLADKQMPWGIVTNKHERFAHKLLPNIPTIAGYKTLVCGDTAAHSKPHPLPLLMAAEQLGVEPQQCWYLGDDIRDMQAAKAAGMTAIVAGWGYLGDTPIAQWPQDHALEKPEDLLALPGMQ